VPLPPVAARAAVYGPPWVAAARGVAVVMDIAGSTVRVGLTVEVAPLTSVTLTVRLYGLPALVPAPGVPVIAPVVVLKAKPVGRPVMDHATAGAPPVRVMGLAAATLYAKPTVAVGSVAVVSTGAAYTVRLRFAVAVTPLLSFTVTLTVLGPSTVDVPLMVPVTLLVPPPAIVKPVGNPVATQLV
jgi:hypothetical protein